jgi:plastocyanin
VRHSLIALSIVLGVLPAEAGTLRGVVWPSAADARRAQQAHASVVVEHYGPFGLFTRHRVVSPAPAKGPDPAASKTSPPATGKGTGANSTRPASAMAVVAQLEPRSHPALKETVVYLDTIPEKVERDLAERARRDRSRPNPRIVQANSKFTPRMTLVAAGTDVEFQNLDTVWHNAFSVSTAETFDLGKYPPGRIETVKFDRAGLVNLHCDIHPEETGFVMVMPNHAYVRPDSLGRFTIAKLPAGKYTLHLWHPRLGEATRTIEMPKHGDLDVDVAF